MFLLVQDHLISLKYQVEKEVLPEKKRLKVEEKKFLLDQRQKLFVFERFLDELNQVVFLNFESLFLDFESFEIYQNFHFEEFQFDSKIMRICHLVNLP